MLITPVYNEECNLDRYAEEILRLVFSREDLDTSVLFVDDGSTDKSWARICDLSIRDSRFSGVRLSRNFGAHVALAAGFDQAGEDVDAVATLACDLQDPPQTVLEFVRSWRKGADIVWGARRTRQDGKVRDWISDVMMGLLRRYAMPRGSRFVTGSFLLMDRKVLECFRRFREHSRVTFALVAWSGFEQDVVLYDRLPRLAGRSGWTFGRMFNTAYDVFIGFSPVPAKLLTITGFTVFGLSLLFIIYLLLTYLFMNVQPGWTGLMATMTLFFGILFVMLGVMAEYLHRIFIETKDRPLYFMSSRTGAGNLAAGERARDE